MLCSRSECRPTALGHTDVATRTRRRHELKDLQKAVKSTQPSAPLFPQENGPSIGCLDAGKPEAAIDSVSDTG